jgi:hypothetical protein
MARIESWASIEFSLLKVGGPAKINTHLRAVTYSDALERELVHGAGRDPIGGTDPVYVPGDMSIEFYFRWWRVLAAELTNNGETRLGDHDIRMILKHQVRGVAGEPLVDTLDFSFVGGDDAPSQGPAALVTTVPCFLTSVERNGVKL